MLLQRLVELAARTPTGKPFHRERGYTWQLNLDLDGNLAHNELQHIELADANGKMRPAPHTTPAAARTVRVAANLAADDVQYVLGWGDEATKPARVAECHQDFVALTERWAESLEGRRDPVARAVATFYRKHAVRHLRRPDEITAKQGVLIAVNSQPAYHAESVVPFWTAEITRRKGDGQQGLCLVCGQLGPLLDTVPGRVPGRLLPGATNDVALVSVNEAVFGYGLRTQLSSTPLCLACGDAITVGLGRVLDPANSSLYPGQDSRMTWWVTGGGQAPEIDLLDEPSPDDIAHLIRSVQHGPAGLLAANRDRDDEGDDDKFDDGEFDDDELFCSLVVAGNYARVVVREWVQMPLPTLRRRLAAWFADHEVDSVWGGQRWQRLRALARCTGRWDRGPGRYAEFGAPGADRPHGVHHELFRAAMRNAPIAPALLAHVLHRVQADGRVDDPRAALLRLALIRSHRSHDRRNPPMPGLDPANTDPSYVAGRAFAVLESIQYAASGGAANTTFGDRYFPGATANPRACLVRGRIDAAAWLRKLRRVRPGAAVNLEKELLEIFDLFDGNETNIPATTTLQEQALFLIGYHHQRAQNFRASKTAHHTTTVEEITA